VASLKLQPLVPAINHLMELDPTHMIFVKYGNTQLAWPPNVRANMQEDPFDFFEEVKGG
jgi:hypothetical protein